MVKGEILQVIRAARRMTNTVLTVTIINDRPARCVSPRTIARVVAIIGVINGAIIIAPITVAVDPAMTPYVEMMVARVRRTP
jgi:hypothetical protein